MEKQAFEACTNRDVVPDHVYGFGGTQRQLTHEQAIQNPDTLMFFGVLSKLLANGWRLPGTGTGMQDGTLVTITPAQPTSSQPHRRRQRETYNVSNLLEEGFARCLMLESIDKECNGM